MMIGLFQSSASLLSKQADFEFLYTTMAKVKQWLTTTLKTDTLVLTASVNKTQIKISLGLYLFQITSWSGWIAARMTSTLSWSHCQNPELELVA